jgi:hypothetical protein
MKQPKGERRALCLRAGESGGRASVKDLIRLFRNNASIFREIHLPHRGKALGGGGTSD